ncbi:uncharacterized protein [Diadema setosum]|uniref:uncharacterized protein n=1 Tax=Diadema setosum TaxID=31175 RepID=UPI003B3B917D
MKMPVYGRSGGRSMGARTPRLFVLLCFLAAALQLQSTSADQVLFFCNFENDCANAIVQERNDEMDFEVGHGWQGEWSTGPEVDHTFKNSSGNYFFINANAPGVRQGYRAVITLPMDPRRFRMGQGELSFAYHMYDGYGSRNNMGTLSVYLLCDGEYNRTWSVDGNQGESWHQVVIPLECSGEPVKVSLEAIRNGVQSDIVIDDIKLVDIFEGDPPLPATEISRSELPQSSRSTPSTSRGGGGLSGTPLLTGNPNQGGTSGQTVLPGGTGSITPPPIGNPNNGLGMDIIIPIAAAALVALILIIILILVLLFTKRKKTKKTGEMAEPPLQLYEDNIFETSPDRKYESLQGPLSNSDRIYEELQHKKSPHADMRRNGGPHTHAPYQHGARMNGHVPPAMRRSMPELGDNFYDRINDRIHHEPMQTHVNAHVRNDNNHNNFIDRSQTYHPSRVSYHSNVEDHPYFTLMPDVVSSTAFQDDRIVFDIPPPPSSTPPPLPPPPREYDYGRPLQGAMPLDEGDIHDLNEYHDVQDVEPRRPRSMNSNFDDEDDFGRHRMAVDLDVEGDRGYQMGSDLRLSRDTDISAHMDLDFDMDVDMRMSADGDIDIHSMDTLEVARAFDRGRDRRSRDMELERNLDHPSRYGAAVGGVDRRMNSRRDYDLESDSKNYQHSPYNHHIDEDPQGHIRMVNLNYSPTGVHV